MTDLLPPVAPRRAHVRELHGERFIDEYYWLRHREDPETIAYLEAENGYTGAVLAHTGAFQEQLYQELRARIKEADTSAPYREGQAWYYTRTLEDAQYPVYCRRQGSLEAPEEVLLDVNQLAAGQSYCRIGVFEVSPNGRLLAYSVDFDGDEVYTLYLKDLETGALLDDRLENTYYNVEWAGDNRTLFYNVLDAAKRPYRIFRHTVGTPQADDPLVLEELDERFFVNIGKTRSAAWLVITLYSFNGVEQWLVPADAPETPARVIEPRSPGVEYFADHHGERLLIRTNADGATNFKLVEAPLDTPGRAHWRELVGHRAETLLDNIEPFQDYLASFERSGGLQRVRILDVQGRELRTVQFPEPTYTVRVGPNKLFATSVLRLTYSSLVTPNSAIDCGMHDASWTVVKQDEIPSGYDPAHYRSERLEAVAPDGVRVPISLVYRRGFERNGQAPLLLYAYGSYGTSMDPSFNANRLSLLDRGFAYAIAHIRGGQELGRAWYEQGRLLHKRNTFTDFIACAEHLVAQGYTSPARLAIMGGSAGGLLMGAVVNMRPDLFGAVVAKVPFVDVINTMTDPSIPLTVPEYEQWGNPADKTCYDYLRSYSPYDNLAPRAYPPMLVTAGLNDPRVHYWEPAKWVARLRTLKTDQNVLLLKTNMDAGHGGASGRFDFLKEIALDYAFLIDTMDA